MRKMSSHLISRSKVTSYYVHVLDCDVYIIIIVVRTAGSTYHILFVYAITKASLHVLYTMIDEASNGFCTLQLYL